MNSAPSVQETVSFRISFFSSGAKIRLLVRTVNCLLVVWLCKSVEKRLFVQALQYAVPQFAEFAIQEMLASEERQYRGTTLHHFAAGSL